MKVIIDEPCGCSTGGLCATHNYLAHRYHYDIAGNQYVTDQYGNRIDQAVHHLSPVRPVVFTYSTLPRSGASNVLFAIVVWCAMAAVEQRHREKMQELYE